MLFHFFLLKAPFFWGGIFGKLPRLMARLMVVNCCFKDVNDRRSTEMGDTDFDPNGKNILQQARGDFMGIQLSISWDKKIGDSNSEIEGTVG